MSNFPPPPPPLISLLFPKFENRLKLFVRVLLFRSFVVVVLVVVYSSGISLSLFILRTPLPQGKLRIYSPFLFVSTQQAFLFKTMNTALTQRHDPPSQSHTYIFSHAQWNDQHSLVARCAFLSSHFMIPFSLPLVIDVFSCMHSFTLTTTLILDYL